VSGAVTWYGIFDFRTLARPDDGRPPAGPGSPESHYLGCAIPTCDRARLAAASPVDHIDAADPPMLLIHGLGDRVVPSGQSAEMAAALGRAGVAARLVLIPDVDHSFIGATPAATRAATYRALDETIAFIDELVGREAR
jgi:dipeptidyl aminopeptidase/acylaminoacyl peptidase